MKYFRFIVAFIICVIALVLPYRVRAAYMSFLSAAVHLPFKIFGLLARKLLISLGEDNPYEHK